MPPVYAIVSFFSYRYFREYTYYELIEVVYESITLAAFMLLLIEYVASTASGHSVSNALKRKDKQKLYFPFCFWQFRPTKPYFMHTVKWAVMQYVIVRPLISIAGIVTQFYGVLCESGTYNPRFAAVYLDSIDFVSISVALYGLILFYGLTHNELAGRRPLAKFLCIKGIVFFTFYQSFVFDALEGRVIHGTEYWTSTNIADGLNALCICIEMVFFSIAFMWAYPASEYRSSKMDGRERMSVFRAIWDSINFSDFVIEIFSSLWFFILYILRRPGTHAAPASPSAAPGILSGSAEMRDGGAPATFDQAFGLNGKGRNEKERESMGSESGEQMRLRPWDAGVGGSAVGPGMEGREEYSDGDIP